MYHLGMKLTKLLITFFTISLLLFVIRPISYASTNFASGDNINLPKGETVTTDYFSAGGTNILDGTVNGDAYVVGGNVVINGEILGDVITAGGNVSINGRVTGNVRAAGGQVIITGEVDKNVTVVGGSVSIQAPATISGSLTAASGNLSVLSPIGKGAALAGGQISINAPIGGDVRVSAEQLAIMQDAKIDGRLEYWSPNQAHIVQFTVKNGVNYHHTEFKNQRRNLPSPTRVAGAMAGFGLIWIIVSLSASFLIGCIFLWLAPVYMQNIALTISEKTLLSLVIGFAGLILVPFTFMVLLITVIGIPFALLLLFGFILAALINQIYIGYAIGKKLLPKRNELALLTGLIIYAIISSIPVVGWMFGAVALFIGVGAMLITQKTIYTSLRTKKLI